MEEVFLYGCEMCYGVIYAYSDHGSTYYCMCKSCSGITFHNKIVIAQGLNLYKESHCYVSSEENTDGNKKEGEVD